jgi:hypothetical protein
MSPRNDGGDLQDDRSQSLSPLSPSTPDSANSYMPLVDQPRLPTYLKRLLEANINSICGAVGGLALGIVTCPLDVIKTIASANIVSSIPEWTEAYALPRHIRHSENNLAARWCAWVLSRTNSDGNRLHAYLVRIHVRLRCGEGLLSSKHWYDKILLLLRLPRSLI